MDPSKLSRIVNGLVVTVSPADQRELARYLGRPVRALFPRG